MGKFILICALIILGLFGVLIINNTNTTIKPATQTSSLSLPSISSTPSTVIINSMENQANSAIIKTSKGDIGIEFYATEAAKTVANFVNKAKSGFYNNLTFHRVEDWVVQGGDPDGNGTGGGKMATELNNKPFVVGSLGVARGGDINISNDSQFFFTKTDASWLNGQYTNFGIVTKGMEVVNGIQIGDEILGITLQ